MFILRIFKFVIISVSIIIGSYGLIKYYDYKYEQTLMSFSEQLKQYAYNVNIENNKLKITFNINTNNKIKYPKYWFMFLVAHNVNIESYKFTQEDFSIICKPEDYFLRRIITNGEYSLPKVTNSIVSNSNINENTNDETDDNDNLINPQIDYKISFLIKNNK